MQSQLKYQQSFVDIDKLIWNFIWKYRGPTLIKQLELIIKYNNHESTELAKR